MPTSLWTTWLETAANDPAALAVIDSAAKGEHAHTREGLSRYAEELAAGAPSQVLEGASVAYCERNGARWIALFLALQKLGTVALPLDAALPEGRRTEGARQLGAHWHCTWEAGRTVWEPLEQAAPEADATADYCVIKTTSGSTGEPKPLLFTSANMLADGRQIAATMGIQPGDRNLGAIPLGHSYGLGNLVLPLIAQGTAVICSTEILPDALAAEIELHRATVLPSVPAVLRALAESSVDAGRLRTLRRVISAGAALTPEGAVAFLTRFGVPIGNFYGSSETGGICFDSSGKASSDRGSVGRPLEGVSVRLDERGRVTVRSPAVVGSGEHTLADLAQWNARGELVLTGRATPLANIGGKKVSPAEIERAIRGLAGVTDAWVGVHARAAGGGDYLWAAVETPGSGDEIRQALSERLPAWQIPRKWWFAPRLPRTARGKLDRESMEARCVEGKSLQGESR